MYLKNFFILISILSLGSTIQAQLRPAIQQTLESLETLRIRNRPKEVLNILEKSIEKKRKYSR